MKIVILHRTTDVIFALVVITGRNSIFIFTHMIGLHRLKLVNQMNQVSKHCVVFYVGSTFRQNPFLRILDVIPNRLCPQFELDWRNDV